LSVFTGTQLANVELFRSRGENGVHDRNTDGCNYTNLWLVWHSQGRDYEYRLAGMWRRVFW